MPSAAHIAITTRKALASFVPMLEFLNQFISSPQFPY
jgi:hypothetical protein